MAKRRKVGNLLGLTVLSALVGKAMHPYEIATVLRERGKDQDMKIKWGSLYTVVQNLEKHGFVEAAESTRQGGRPERTVYRITEAGREELNDWVRELLSDPEPERPRFKLALSNMVVLGPDEAVQLLRRRLGLLETEIAGSREELARISRELPRLLLVEAEYDLTLRQAEADWVRSLLGEFEAGSLPGVDVWRAWHDTGVIPPEIVELAERSKNTE